MGAALLACRRRTRAREEEDVGTGRKLAGFSHVPEAEITIRGPRRGAPHARPMAHQAVELTHTHGGPCATGCGATRSGETRLCSPTRLGPLAHGFDQQRPGKSRVEVDSQKKRSSQKKEEEEDALAHLQVGPTCQFVHLSKIRPPWLPPKPNHLPKPAEGGICVVLQT
jgi:hypothetical protein